MSEDQAEISKLIGLLKRVGRTDEEIISILEDMIKCHMMYGGSLRDAITYRFVTTEKEGLRSGRI